MMLHIESVLGTVSVLLTEVFFTGLWQGIGTVLVIAAMLRLFPRVSAEAKYSVLGVAFVLLAGLPWVHLPEGRLMGPGTRAAVHVTPVLARVIAAVWTVLAFVRAAQLIQAWCYLRAVWRRAVPFEVNPDYAQPLVCGKRPVVWCTSADVDSPTVLGFRRPRFLLPEWLAPTLTESDLRQIALHECEHLRRHDQWTNLLQEVVLLALPLHPALLWLNRRLNLQRELACDAGVIASTAEPVVYASCLTRLAEQRLQHRDQILLGLAAWGRRSELAHRVHRLIQDRNGLAPGQSRLAVSALMLAFATGGFVMARVPRLVHVDADQSQGGLVMASQKPVAIASRPTLTMQRDLPRAASLEPVAYRYAGPEVGGAESRQTNGSALVVPRAAVRKDRAAKAIRRPFISARTRPLPRVEPSRVLTPTKFTQAYAAVPFGDGWLLIQL